MKKAGTLTPKQRQFAILFCDYPFEKNSVLAEKAGITEVYASKLKKMPEFQAFLAELLEDRWKDAGIKARKKMMELAFEKDDYKAIEFLLRTNGLNPVQKVESEVKELVITITGEEDETEFR